MTIFNTIVGVISLIVGVVGACITCSSLINPKTRFGRYLRKREEWERLLGKQENLSIYRHKKYPGFQITIDWSEPICSNFKMDWIKSYPDKENNQSYCVELVANNILISTEMFVFLDGGRIFVPVPEREVEGDKIIYFYNPRQVKLANIIGKYGLYENIKEFIVQQEGLILIKECKAYAAFQKLIKRVRSIFL